MDKHYYETNDTQDILRDRIKMIETEQDELEQKFYRDKIKLEAEYHATYGTLLSQKTFLKEWFNAEEWQNVCAQDYDDLLNK